MSGKVAPSRRSVTLFRGSTVSCHSLSYFVDVPVPGKRCVSERKNILNGVRQDLRQSVAYYSIALLMLFTRYVPQVWID